MARYPVQQISGNFLRVLLEHNRIRYFKEIYDAFVRICNERKGIVSAQVVTAAPAGRWKVETANGSACRKATGRAVTLNVRTDADLVGGLVVQIGSTVYDGSIRTQLNEVKATAVRTIESGPGPGDGSASRVARREGNSVCRSELMR